MRSGLPLNCKIYTECKKDGKRYLLVVVFSCLDSASTKIVRKRLPIRIKIFVITLGLTLCGTMEIFVTMKKDNLKFIIQLSHINYNKNDSIVWRHAVEMLLRYQSTIFWCLPRW